MSLASGITSVPALLSHVARPTEVELTVTDLLAPLAVFGSKESMMPRKDTDIVGNP
jgi:hypothetical protein